MARVPNTLSGEIKVANILSDLAKDLESRDLWVVAG